jgi:hypothetical protein
MRYALTDHLDQRDRERTRKLQIRDRIFDALRDGVERTPDQVATITGLGRLAVCIAANTWTTYFEVERRGRSVASIAVHRHLRKP